MPRPVYHSLNWLRSLEIIEAFTASEPFAVAQIGFHLTPLLEEYTEHRLGLRTATAVIAPEVMRARGSGRECKRCCSGN